MAGVSLSFLQGPETTVGISTSRCSTSGTVAHRYKGLQLSKTSPPRRASKVNVRRCILDSRMRTRDQEAKGPTQVVTEGLQELR